MGVFQKIHGVILTSEARHVNNFSCFGNEEENCEKLHFENQREKNNFFGTSPSTCFAITKLL
jgi:hypothetical protein